MARQSLQKVYADFRKGWVDISSPLQQPEGTVKDIVNFDINIDGTLTKRKGLDYSGEALAGSYTSSVLEEPHDVLIWDNVAKNVDRKFLVFRRRNTIDIFDISHGNVDLSNTYKVYSGSFSRGQFSGVNSKKMDGVSALGNFFIAFNSYGVGYFSYNDITGTVSFKEIRIKFRDLDLWEGSNDTETGFNKYSNSLTYPWHTYNMYNSGWNKRTYVSQEENPNNGTFNTSPMGYTRRVLGYWPPMTIPFSACKAGAGGGINEITAYNAWYTEVDYFGNTTPPLGRNIFDLYQFTREGEVLYQTTGQAGSAYDIQEYHRETYTLDEAPSKIAFYAGRLWYAGVGTHTSSVSTSRPKDPYSADGNIYFSQTLGTNIEKAGRCYQENDPTAEDINQLLATDGGSFSIKEAGTIRAMVPLSTSLFIFSDQGVWRVAGTDFNSFTPEAYSIDKITDKGMTSDTGFAVSEDTIYFMTEDGLFAIAAQGQLGEIAYNDLSTPLIKNFFSDVPRKAISNCLVRFDRTKNILVALLAIPTGEQPESFFRRNYNLALIYNADLNCFYKYQFYFDQTSDDIKILDGVFGPALALTQSTENVTDSLGATVTDSGLEAVFVLGEDFFQEADDRLTLIMSVNGIIYPVSFVDDETYQDISLVYGASVDIGYDTLGDLLSDRKQAPYIVAYLERDYAISEVTGGGGPE